MRAPNGILNGVRIRAADRIAAVKLDAELAGQGGEGHARDIRVVIGGAG